MGWDLAGLIYLWVGGFIMISLLTRVYEERWLKRHELAITIIWPIAAIPALFASLDMMYEDLRNGRK